MKLKFAESNLRTGIRLYSGLLLEGCQGKMFILFLWLFASTFVGCRGHRQVGGITPLPTNQYPKNPAVQSSSFPQAAAPQNSHTPQPLKGVESSISMGQNDATLGTGNIGRNASSPQTNVVTSTAAKEWVNLNQLVQSRFPQYPVIQGIAGGFGIDTPHGTLRWISSGARIQWDGVDCWTSGGINVALGSVLQIRRIDMERSVTPLLDPIFGEPQPGRSVVIDAGHGGKSVGTKSVITGRFEKDYALDWSLRLSRLLSNKGWKVIMTRTNDTDIPLAHRVFIAEEAKADLFLSLHFNSEPKGSQSGIETYCMPPVGMASHLVRDSIDLPNLGCANNRFDDENLRFGMRVHSALIKLMQRPDRGMRRARYPVVLRHQNRPAILVEGGYLSNRGEASLIADANYRQKLAESVASAFPMIKP